MPTRKAVVCVCAALVIVGVNKPASAQSSAPLPSNRATGENYHIEISGSLWDPTPSIFISSESIEGILGSRIDFVEDLGIEKSWFKQLRVVARPAEKHKFRFEYTPIKYDAETVLTRTLIFNGISFPVSIPIESEVSWRAYRFTYEWDFVYKDRGFVGLILEAKYTDVSATLTNLFDTEFVRARAPIPAVGIIGRGYVAANISITSEFSFFKVPDLEKTTAAATSTSTSTARSTSTTMSACRVATGRLTCSTRSNRTRATCRFAGRTLEGWFDSKGSTGLLNHQDSGFTQTPRNRSSLLPGVDSDGRNPDVVVAVTSAARWPGATGTWTRRSSPGASVSSSRH